MTTCGMSCSSLARWPAPFAYQVCECTRSAPPTSWAICRSTPSVASAGFAGVELRRHEVREHVRLVAGGAEAADDDVDVVAQRRHEFGDVHAGTPVDLGRVLAADQIDSHDLTLVHGSGARLLLCHGAQKIFGIVLAGGEGKRLMPLTADRAKPAVPFAGGYRLIDFALSNLINSGLRQIVVLTQYKSHSLDRHVSQTWRLSGMLNSYVASVPAQQRLGKRWFSGSADAILQSLNLLRDEKPDIVVVVGADHVYRMDFSQMIEAHIDSGRGVTVAAIRQPIALADQFGVIEARAKTTRRRSPPSARSRRTRSASPTPRMRCSPRWATTSSTPTCSSTRCTATARCRTPTTTWAATSFPTSSRAGEAGVYDFNRNDVPGSTDRDRFYWRDVGTIESFFEAHQDLISALPIFNLYNREWPIFSQQLNSPPAKFVRDAKNDVGTTIDSIVSLGCVISGAHLERSVLGPWTTIESGAKVVDSVVFERVDDRRERRGPARYPRQGRRRRRRARPSASITTRIAHGLHRHRLRHHRRRQGRPRRRSSARFAGARRRPPMARFLVVLDVDSTLIENEVIELLAEEAGSLERVAEITFRAMNGELDFEESLRERVATLAGLPESVFETVGRRITVTPRRPEMIAGVQAAGGRVGGRLRRIPRGPRPDRRANSASTTGGPTASRSSTAGSPAASSGRSSTPRRRPTPCVEWARTAGIPLAQTVAVGDGANDLPMMAISGLAVGFDAKAAGARSGRRAARRARPLALLPLLGLRG